MRKEYIIFFAFYSFLCFILGAFFTLGETFMNLLLRIIHSFFGG